MKMTEARRRELAAIEKRLELQAVKEGARIIADRFTVKMKRYSPLSGVRLA